MSHVNGIAPAGPLTVASGSTTTFTVDLQTAADSSYALDVVADDGSQVTVSVLVDRPEGQLVIGGSAPLAAHQARVTASGGSLAAVAGQPLQFAWTAP